MSLLGFLFVVVVHRYSQIKRALLQPCLPVLQHVIVGAHVSPVVVVGRSAPPGNERGADFHLRFERNRFKIDLPHQVGQLVAAPLHPARVFGTGRASGASRCVEAADADVVVTPLHAGIANEVQVNTVDFVILHEVDDHIGRVLGR